MHPAPHTEDGLIPSFDLARDALVLPKPMSFCIDKGYTTPAIATNLQNLGVKIETPKQAGIPESVSSITISAFQDNFRVFEGFAGFSRLAFSAFELPLKR